MVQARGRATGAHRSLSQLGVVAQADAVALDLDIAQIVKWPVLASGKAWRAHQKEFAGPPGNLARAKARARIGDEKSTVSRELNQGNKARIAHMITVRSDAEGAGMIALHHEIVEAKSPGQDWWAQALKGKRQMFFKFRRQVPKRVRFRRRHADVKILAHNTFAGANLQPSEAIGKCLGGG